MEAPPSPWAGNFSSPDIAAVQKDHRDYARPSPASGVYWSILPYEVP